MNWNRVVLMKYSVDQILGPTWCEKTLTVLRLFFISIYVSIYHWTLNINNKQNFTPFNLLFYDW